MELTYSVESLSQFVFFRLKRLLDVVGCGTITRFTVTHIGLMLCARDGTQNRFLNISEMFDDTKRRSGLYPLFHIALLNDFGRFALCISDRLFESAISLHSLDNYNILNQNQFGFLQGHSSHHALNTLVNKITKSLDTGDMVIEIFLDLKSFWNSKLTNYL